MDQETLVTVEAADSDRQRRWRAPLVTVVIYLLMFESLSGFVLFFFGPFVGDIAGLGALHWWLGVGFLGPYGIYQLRHYLRVRNQAGRFHFRVGLSTFLLMTTVIISGVLMWFAESRTSNYYGWVDLTHIMVSFALLIMLSSHLVLVFKVGRRQEQALGARTVKRRIMNRVLWYPSLLSAALIGAWFLWERL